DKKPKEYKETNYSTSVGDDGEEYVLTQESAYDLSISRYKKVMYDEVHYDAPKEILKRIKTLQTKMAKGVVELEKLL
ncbi:MAG: SAM-dependent DNA methyltransferase, partial [Pseudoalteromonas distincta]